MSRLAKIVKHLSAEIEETSRELSGEQHWPGASADNSDDKIKRCKEKLKKLRELRELAETVFTEVVQ